jgi:ribosomal protein S18 acetylase RimI-like enzyme
MISKQEFTNKFNLEEKVVGYLIAEKVKAGGAIIWYLAIEKKHRNQGLGRKLLSEFENRCRKNRIEWINLYALENKKTLGFYKSMGYSFGEKEREIIKLLNVKRFKDLKINN